MASKVRYLRCPECNYMKPQLDEKVIKGKRVMKCPSCARKAGWYSEDAEPKQGKLFEKE